MTVAWRLAKTIDAMVRVLGDERSILRPLFQDDMSPDRRLWAEVLIAHGLAEYKDTSCGGKSELPNGDVEMWSGEKPALWFTRAGLARYQVVRDK